MKKTTDNFGLPKDKVAPADPREVMRFKQAVREKVVKAIEDRASAQKQAVATARARTVR